MRTTIAAAAAILTTASQAHAFCGFFVGKAISNGITKN